MSNQNTIKLYYFTLGVCTFVFALMTVFIGSHHVPNGQILAQLESKQQQQAESKRILEKELSQQLSLNSNVATAMQQGFTSSHQVLRPVVTSMMASR